VSIDSATSFDRLQTRIDSSDERDFTVSSICVIQNGQPTATVWGRAELELIEALLVYSFCAFFFFFPKIATPCATAEGAILTYIHVFNLDAGNCAECAARAVPVAVCAARY